MSTVPAVARASDWREIVATVILALAAVTTAWSSYQATRWNGEQAKAAARAQAFRSQAARSATLAQDQTQVDIATFIAWADATGSDDAALADFYRQRFRPEFRPAFEAWLAKNPLTTPDAPPTPFAMPEYRLAATAEAERLDAASELAAASARVDVQRSANYVLGVVLFAVALFFAGMSAKLRGAGPRTALLTIGCVVFVAGAVWIATFPVSLSV